jgi:hypothetical protein
MRFTSRILLFVACAWLVACSTQEVYTGESFASDSPFKMRVKGDVAPACESARRSLLGQGYLIESASEEGIKARKAARGGETQNTFIEMNIVCLPEPHGSTLFATGVLTTYALKKSSSSASVGLAALGSISLPIGQSADSLVKVSEETIDDKDFYGRFFMAVSNTLDEMESGKAPPVPPTETAMPAAPVMPATPDAPGATVQAAPSPVVAVPATSTAGTSAPNSASPAVVTPVSATPISVQPTAAQPIASQPMPATAPAPAAVLPAAAITPAPTPAPTPKPEVNEQAPTYTLQPDATQASPAATSQAAPSAAETPVPAVEPVTTEEAPAAVPQPTANDKSPPAPEPAAEPAPQSDTKAVNAEPVVDNNLLFL